MPRSSVADVAADEVTLRPLLRLHVELNMGGYEKTFDCTHETIGNMVELLAAINERPFIALFMEDDVSPTLVNTRYIVVIEEQGLR